ncbi:MAG: hypothetical protein IJ653_04240 [Bacteroidales bacterium]|nr:hypothetical protein [Bacteroidales bacterium]
MKKLLYLLPALLLLAACSAGDRLKTGDLIFVGIPADYRLDTLSMDAAITAATGGDKGLNLIHAAIAEVDKEGRAWIIDATIKHGVDRHPLDTFLRDFTLRDGSYPVFEVMRLRDGRRAQPSVENAKRFLGLPYDIYFLPENEALYCTELIYSSYRQKDGKPIFTAAPMNFKDADGNFPVYWQQLFERLGQPIPQDVPGTNPQAMSKEPALRPVAVEIVRE